VSVISVVTAGKKSTYAKIFFFSRQIPLSRKTLIVAVSTLAVLRQVSQHKIEI